VFKQSLLLWRCHPQSPISFLCNNQLFSQNARCSAVHTASGDVSRPNSLFFFLMFLLPALGESGFSGGRLGKFPCLNPHFVCVLSTKNVTSKARLRDSLANFDQCLGFSGSILLPLWIFRIIPQQILPGFHFCQEFMCFQDVSFCEQDFSQWPVLRELFGCECF
jgi:hypothetical protein